MREGQAMLRLPCPMTGKYGRRRIYIAVKALEDLWT
jgi:hypothetical protein